MTDKTKPPGWWLHYKTNLQEGHVIGFLLEKTDQTTVLVAHLRADYTPDYTAEIMAFRNEFIVAQGPVMLGTQVSREEYERMQKEQAARAK
jgi:hypothetical protein